jgi:uncharacterized membrane protein YjjP (DUF1212 family)
VQNPAYRTPVDWPLLEPLVMAALDAGGMLMEAGASGRGVQEIVQTVAYGFGAEQVDVHIGYASMAVTVRRGDAGITCLREVGHIGVNERMAEELWKLARQVSRGRQTIEQVRLGLKSLRVAVPRHAPPVVAIAVGLACAAFGRLLGLDWRGTGPVFIAAMIGQYVRHELLRRNMNVFVCAAVVSSLSSFLSDLGAHWTGSLTYATAMISPVLLLVPGIAAINAQTDILEGRPSLGSVRAVTVLAGC